MHSRAQILIDELQLQPHPEGGFYREIHRSSSQVQPLDDRGVRSALTTIYFLLMQGMQSRWHRVRSDEVWHLYEGGPLELLLADSAVNQTSSVTLTAASAEAGPAHTILAGWWQAARPIGAYALVGCTVGPGFEFKDFSFLRDDAAATEKLRRLQPQWTSLL